jgi:VWFA-related protein
VDRLRLSHLVIVCLLLGSTVSLRSQQTPPPTQPTFRVGATFVRVDAFVTKDGKPVTDLTPDDIELSEDGVRQTIRTFEYVNIPSAVLQTSSRRDPETVAESRERVADPRRRVFVLFLDTYHTAQGSSMGSRKAFLRFLQRMVGPDDLIAGVTPEMSLDAISFGSRTDSLESFLNDLWGKRDSIIQDQEEDWMQTCFSNRETWKAMRERRRAKLTLDALEGLVQRLGAMRDERKAIITVTEGWQFFREDMNLIRDPDNPNRTPTGPGIVMGPGGRLGTGDASRGGAPTAGECDKVRMELAGIETVEQFRHLPDEANRANASFYVIDPRGLAASDDLLGSPSPSADISMLKNKLSALRELAERTDGMAMLSSNDLDKELTRIAQDLSSYYLFGYDSTNAKLDGSYRSITVKVKRPGVLVRARRGYRAATLPSASASNSRGSGGDISGGASAGSAGADNDITPAITSVMGTRADLPVRMRATAVRLLATESGAATGAGTSELRLVVELDPKLAASDAWRQGGTAHIVARGEGPNPGMSADVTLPAGARILSTTIPLRGDNPSGDYRVQLRLTAQSKTDAVSDSTLVHIGAPGLIGEPLVLRRGVTTGTAYQPTADMRFRRSDRIRLEAPSRLTSTQVRVTAVDQRGKPLALPVQVSDRPDGASSGVSTSAIIVDIALAPLAPGGYAIVLATKADSPNTVTERVIVPFQLIP